MPRCRGTFFAALRERGAKASQEQQPVVSLAPSSDPPNELLPLGALLLQAQHLSNPHLAVALL